MPRHCEAKPREMADFEDDAWVHCEPDENLESFLAAFPPSTTEKSWITAQHDARKQLVEQYYLATGGEGKHGREQMDDVREEWEESETKSLETLTAVLKKHRYGCGKWMVFAKSEDVDAVWAKIVTSLWEGKLGASAKVSGVASSGSHVVCVYVDPFWETGEVERVLSALRHECGVVEAIKYKVDGITLLNLPKDNEFGVPPSFYAANRESLSLTLQTHGRPKGGEKADKAKKWTRPEKPEPVEKVWRDADGFEGKVSKGSRGGPPPPAAAAPEAEEKKKKKPKADVGGFAALAGFDEGDADEILAKKDRKAAKKAAKKAAEEAAMAEQSAADFEALKASVASGGRNWGEDEDEEDGEAPQSAPPEEEEEEQQQPSRTPRESAQSEEGGDDAAPGAAPEGGAAGQQPESAKERRAKQKKDKPKEEEDVEALLAALEEPKAKDGEGDEPKGLSKAAQKRAKQAAKKAQEEASGAAAEGGEGEEENAAPDDAESGTKSAEEIRQMMAKRAADAKKKKAGKSSDAAAIALKEAKSREGDKKKKGTGHYAQGPGKQVGQKARGSDNKYQGE